MKTEAVWRFRADVDLGKEDPFEYQRRISA